MRRSLAAGWPVLLIVALLSIGLAIACFRRQSRFGQSHAWSWAVFVFIFGVPGYLGYWLHRRWPVRTECPACRQLTPRDRLDCLDCGQTFPTPARKGIEVFG